MKIVIALALIRVLSWLPLRPLYALADPVGRLLFRLPLRKHAVIRTNLAIAFPELSPEARARLHRGHLIEMVRMVLESGAIWHWSAERLQRHVRVVKGWSHVEAAQQAGRGVLLISGHLGSWELGPLLAGLNGGFSGLYKAPRDPRVDRAVTRSRGRFGAQLITTGSPAMRRLLRELKAGGVVGLLMDQQPRQGEGVWAPFFGRLALTMSLVHRLARRTDCAVIFGSVRRTTRPAGWEFHLAPVCETVAGDDPVAAATALNAHLERAIRSVPAQYLWLYKRWSLQPGDLGDPYRDASA